METAGQEPLPPTGEVVPLAGPAGEEGTPGAGALVVCAAGTTIGTTVLVSWVVLVEDPPIGGQLTPPGHAGPAGVEAAGIEAAGVEAAGLMMLVLGAPGPPGPAGVGVG